ncbi:MAG: xylose isomerase [Candidatus Latescibacteria bacterium]|nr:xylose isomerase [Candidatus Latescibacterota bacterium]
MAKKKAAKTPQLHLCAAAWTMTNYPSAKRQWSAETKVKRAKEAGFTGFSAGADPQLVNALHKHGMTLVGGVDVGSVDEAEGKLQAFKDAGAIHINIQLCDHDTPTKEALPVARQVIQVGDSLGLKPAIEWHRDTCTETPEKAMALAEAYEKRYKSKLRMNFDHSHPAIIKQVRPDAFWDRLKGRLDLLRMSELIHLRTFTGSHCQTPITNGKGKLDADFITWRDKFCSHLLDGWLKGQRGAKSLYAVIELGPKGSGYALDCFPDVWEDAIVARAEVEKVWNGLIKQRSK